MAQKPLIIAEERIDFDCESPEWHIISDADEGREYLIDFSITKQIVFHLGNGKTYHFSLVKVE